MDESRFWKIIEGSGSPYDPERKENLLRQALLALPSADLVEFDRIYHEKLRRAFTWDLWAAGFVIGRGCSDDGFTEFRNFVIGHGRSFYEAAVADPDSMATALGEVREEGGMRMPYLSDYDLIAREVFTERTGKDLPFQSSGAKEPSGSKFSETREELLQRCPKLWARFGGDWIQRFERR